MGANWDLKGLQEEPLRLARKTPKVCNEDLKGLQEGSKRFATRRFTRMSSKFSKEDLQGLQERPKRTSKVILIPIQELQHLARRALNWWSRLPLESNGPSLTITSAFSAQHVANASRNTRQIEQEM